MRFTVKNTRSAQVEATLPAGWRTPSASTTATRRARGATASSPATGSRSSTARRRSRPSRARRRGRTSCSRTRTRTTYEGWTVEGTAFGSGPDREDGDSRVPGRRRRRHRARGQLARHRAGHERRASATTRPARSPAGRSPSSATSSSSGSAAATTRAQTCLNLLVDGKVVRSATGRNNNRMTLRDFDVRAFRGQDRPRSRSWTRRPAAGATSASTRSCSATGRPRSATVRRRCPTSARWGWRCSASKPATLRGEAGDSRGRCVRADRRRSSSANSAASFTLEPGRSATVTFVVTWHFPNLELAGLRERGRYYATKFDVGARRGPVRRRELRPAGRADAAVARHVVRLDAAVLVPRPHASRTPRSSPPRPATGSRTAGSGLGRRGLLRGHLRPRLAIRPRDGAAVPRPRTRTARAGGLRPRAAAGRRDPLPRRVQQHPGHRRPGRHDPARAARAPDVGRRRVPEARTGRRSSAPPSG